jgi:hypothetical protein
VRPPLRLLRLANPLVALILRSRARGLLDRSLMLLTYTGPRSGRVFTIPLRYARDPADALVALAVVPERKLWWRAFRAGAPATALVAGVPLEVRGRVLTGSEAGSALGVYLARYPRARRAVGAPPRGGDHDLDAAARQVALVRFEPARPAGPGRENPPA